MNGTYLSDMFCHSSEGWPEGRSPGMDFVIQFRNGRGLRPHFIWSWMPAFAGMTKKTTFLALK